MGSSLMRPSFKAVEVDSHKFYAPHSADGVLRAGILERVFGNQAPRIALLQGPAGHGKTTSLLQIKRRCEAQGQSTSWLSFDEADNDTRRFSSHLYAAVGRLCGEAAITIEAESGSQYRSDWLIERLARVRRPLALFFDEFQTLRDRAILEFWRDFLARAPANLRIFIGTRTIPELGLARLVVGGHALVLRAEDLRFSADEVRHFFSATPGLELGDEEVDAIFRRSEGWPAALQLFRLSLNHPSTRHSLGELDRYHPRELAEYLTDCVLSVQLPAVREFLIHTAPLTRLSAPLCEAVAEQPGAQALLLELERAGLFLRVLDSEMRWFRYHGLFASFLIDQLRSNDPSSEVLIHQRAARWHQAQGYHEDAIYHAVECRDFPLAAEILTAWSSRLIAGGQMLTVERWLDRLPLEEIAKHRDLVLKGVWALVFLRGRTKLERFINLLKYDLADRTEGFEASRSDIILSIAAICADQISRAFSFIERVQVDGSPAEGFSAFELAAAANMHAYRLLITGDFTEAHAYLIRAKAYNLLGAAPFTGGYTACFEGVGLLLQGQLRKASKCFLRGLEEQRTALDKSFVTAVLASCSIWALYEANELEQLDAVFEEYRDVISESAVPDFFMLGQVSMARACVARGRADEATAILDHAERVALGNSWPRIVDLLNWERLRLALIAGDLNRAHEVFARVCTAGAQSTVPWVPVSEELEGALYGRIRFALATGELGIAAALLSDQPQRDSGRVYRQIRLCILHALLLDRRGLRAPALRKLRKALDLAERGGYVRIFLDEGDVLLDLLSEIVKAERSGSSTAESRQAFSETVLRSVRIDGSASRDFLSDITSGLDALTEREHDIFKLLGMRLSNREIAERSFLSENTVKFHLKNIFSKLKVTNRLQAFAACRDRVTH